MLKKQYKTMVRGQKWCRHISWENIFGGVHGWTFIPHRNDTSNDLNATNWKFCPTCGAARPNSLNTEI
jgi:hypothetical protein